MNLIVLLLFIGLYLLPAILAQVRLHRHRHAILTLNVLLGLFALAYILLLIWAAWPGMREKVAASRAQPVHSPHPMP